MRQTHHTSVLRWVLTASIMLALAGFAAALPGEEGAPFTMDWHTVDGGGGECTDGSYTLTGTVGQHDAGAMSGGAAGATSRQPRWVALARTRAVTISMPRPGRS